MRKNAVFGKNREPHTIIIAQGQSVRHFTIKPWVFFGCGAVLAALCVGYLTATSYLIFRDDLLSATMARQARLQHTYEDRIAALRSQVDRITSHRLLDQQVMETKLAELMNRQSLLAERAGVVDPLMERVRSEGLQPASTKPKDGTLPVPTLRPGTDVTQATAFAPPVTASLGTRFDLIETGSVPSADTPGKVRQTLDTVSVKLQAVESAQIEQLKRLRQAANDKKMELVQSARAVGLNVTPAEAEANGVGGPLLPARETGTSSVFVEEMSALNGALDALDATRNRVKAFPIANPAPGRSISSRFGNRRDPIVGRTAFHAGIDFRTPTGTPILATADGVVSHAGRKGGYGIMVELRHANGLTTRYAHLSRAQVKKGHKVKAGQTIGKAGSTGRSTGPHLHYEVRTDGKALNPANYLAAGRKLADKL